LFSTINKTYERTKAKMKTKILSILLTVAMLVAMVPMIAVSAEEPTGTVYEVTDAASITALLADSTKNATGNTMKLTQDLTYTPPTTDPSDQTQGWSNGYGIWDGCKMDIDGNGHTVTLGEGYYYGAILFGFAGRSTTLTMKNLAIVMAVENGEQAVAKRWSKSEYLSFFGQLNTPSQAAIGTGCEINVENCYFDVNFEATATGSNAGAAILVARVSNTTATLTINAKNSYFKANFKTGVASGAETGSGGAGALVGRRVTPGDGAALNVSVENCVFDVTSNALNSGAVIGQGTTKDETVVNLTTTGTNLIYGGEGKVSTVASTGTYTGFTTVAAGDNTVTTVKGYQTTAAVDNKFDLRLVGLVDVANVEDLANYSKVGFVVVANYANTNTKCTTAASNKVYNSITENTATSTNALTATALGGDYIYALAIKNIPANAGDVTFTVTPYYVAADGTTVVYGENTVFTVDVSELPTDTLDAAA
jgi:hypothetical protein